MNEQAGFAQGALEPLDGLGLDVVWVLAVGACTVALWVFGRRALALLPLGEDWRRVLRRVEPLLGLLAALVFALFATRTLFARYGQVLPFALLLVLGAFIASGWGLVRDFLAGVALRAETAVQVDDQVRVGELTGRVRELGPRALVLETSEGDVALVPYTAATRAALIRSRTQQAGSAHTFRVQLPVGPSLEDTRAAVVRAALCCHWSALNREPELHPREDGTAEVTVFALDARHSATVEGAVRHALSSA